MLVLNEFNSFSIDEGLQSKLLLAKLTMATMHTTSSGWLCMCLNVCAWRCRAGAPFPMQGRDELSMQLSVLVQKAFDKLYSLIWMMICVTTLLSYCNRIIITPNTM